MDIFLADNLQRVSNATGHDGQVKDGTDTGCNLFPAGLFTEQHHQAADDGTAAELYRGKAYGVKIADKEIYDENLDGKKDGAGQGQQITLVDAETFRNADEIHADDGQYNS